MGIKISREGGKLTAVPQVKPAAPTPPTTPAEPSSPAAVQPAQKKVLITPISNVGLKKPVPVAPTPHRGVMPRPLTAPVAKTIPTPQAKPVKVASVVYEAPEPVALPSYPVGMELGSAVKLSASFPKEVKSGMKPGDTAVLIRTLSPTGSDPAEKALCKIRLDNPKDKYSNETWVYRHQIEEVK